MDGRELPRDGIILSFLLDGLKEASSGYTIKYWKQGNSTFNQICGNIQYSLLEIRKLNGKRLPGRHAPELMGYHAARAREKTKD